MNEIDHFSQYMPEPSIQYSTNSSKFLMWEGHFWRIFEELQLLDGANLSNLPCSLEYIMGFKFTKFFTLLTIVYMNNVALSDNDEHNTLIGNNYRMTVSEGDPCYQKHKNLPSYEDKIEICYEEMTAPNHPLNRIKIPSDCFDPNGTFFPIRYIYSRRIGMTESEFIQPISSSKFRKTDKAFLTYDFNGDKVQDYIFIEKATSSPPILVTCISNLSTQGRAREQVYVLKGEYKKSIRDIIDQHNSTNIRIDYTYIELSSDKSLLISEYHNRNLNPSKPMFGDLYRTKEYAYSPKQKGFYLISEKIDDASQIIYKNYIKKIKESRYCSGISMHIMCDGTEQTFTSKIKTSDMQKKIRLDLKKN